MRLRKRARVFVLLLSGLIVIFLAVNIVLWKGWVEIVSSSLYAGGDLSRMGYLPGSRMPRQATMTLPRRHLEMSDYAGQPVDVLTIGDSFSNAGFVGENGYYQDHIATLSNCTVLNVIPVEQGNVEPFVTIVRLINSGFIERVAPRYLILSTSERLAMERFGRKFDFSITATPDEESRYRRSGIELFSGKSNIRFINTGNFKFLANIAWYGLTGHNLDKRVYVTRLRQPMFTVKDADRLVYYKEDTKNIPKSTPETVAHLNSNLNHVADMLAARGVKLYFMPAVDKYNLYRDYLLDDSAPRSRFFELLRPLPKRYTLIDTKMILAEELRKGVKDIYFADDTHWSWRASDAIFHAVKFSPRAAKTTAVPGKSAR